MLDPVQREDEPGLVGQGQQPHAQGLLPGLFDPGGPAVVARGDDGQVHVGGHARDGEPPGERDGAGPPEVGRGRPLVLFPGQLPEQQQGPAGHVGQVDALGGVQGPKGVPGGGAQPVGGEPAQFHVHGAKVHEGGVLVGRVASEQCAGDVEVPQGLRGAARQGGEVAQPGVEAGAALGGYLVLAAVAAEGVQEGGGCGQAVEPGRAGDGVQQAFQHRGAQFGRGVRFDEPVGPGEQFHGPVHRALARRPPGRLAVQTDGLGGVARVLVQLGGVLAPGPGQPGVELGQGARGPPYVPGPLPGPRSSSRASAASG